VETITSEELHNFCSSPNIIRVTVSRSIKQMGHVVCIGEIRNAHQIVVSNLKGTDRFGGLGINGR
jgi:hypothetical protein